MIIFTLYSPNDHHFSMLYKKKKQNCSGDLDPRLHQDIALDPIAAPHRPPTSIVFGFAKNPCTHIFSVLSPYLATIFVVSAVQIS